MSVRFKFGLAPETVAVEVRVVVVGALPTTLCRIFRSSSKFFYFSLILSAFEMTLLWPGFGVAETAAFFSA